VKDDDVRDFGANVMAVFQATWQSALSPHGPEQPAFPVIAKQYILRRSAAIRSERHLQPSMLKSPDFLPKSSLREPLGF
jgi:hypothetical protein